MAQKIPLDTIPETISQMRVCIAEKTRTIENVCFLKINKSYQFPTVFCQDIMVRCKNVTLKKTLWEFMFVFAATGDKQSRPDIANMQ